MPTYAIHHDWIDGHAMQGSVGIWNEFGENYYPANTEHFRGRGHRVKSRPHGRSWAGHLEYLTETASAYNANWSAVESERSMQEVIEALHSTFLADSHPVKSFVAPDSHLSPHQESEGREEDSAEPDVSKDPLQVHPATRFVLAQTWWVVSEFMRRHPDWAIRYGDHLSYLTLVNPRGDLPHVVCNPDTVHLFGEGSVHETIRNLLSADDPHSVIKDVERFLGNAPRKGAPPSTPRSLAYRFLATALTATVNDRASWEVRNEILGDDEYGHGVFRGFYLSSFHNAELAATSVSTEFWDGGERLRHFWALLRDGTPVAIVSTEGIVYRQDRQIDLTTEYRRQDSRMMPVLVSALADLLP
jgi:hypothetical protein